MNRILLQREIRNSIGFTMHNITTDITQSLIARILTIPQIPLNPPFRDRILTRQILTLTIVTLVTITQNSNLLTLKLGMSM
jgi:hypothetical protein